MADKKYVEIDKVVSEIKRFVGYLDDDMICRLEIAVNRIPAADVREVKRRKWEYSFYDEDGLEICECVCSACHDYKETFAKWLYDEGHRNWFNFCPNCGADMREES